MKKALTLISSAVLALLMAFPSPALAQHAKKLAAKGKNATIELKASPQKPAAKGGIYIAQKRRVGPPAFPSLKRALAAPTLKHRGSSLKQAAAAAGIPQIVGMVGYQSSWTDTDNQPVGLYTINATGSPELRCLGPQGYSGIEVDGVYYTNSYMAFLGMVFTTIYGYDPETGEELFEYYGADDDTFVDFAADPSTGDVYAIGFNSTLSGYQLSKVNLGTEQTTKTVIAALPGDWNALACDASGQLYGISYVIEQQGEDNVVTSSTLNKIDKATGAVTAIGTTGQLPAYLSSAAIDPRSGRMFWTVCPPDNSGLLCEVNLTTGQASLIAKFVDDDQVLVMSLS